MKKQETATAARKQKEKAPSAPLMTRDDLPLIQYQWEPMKSLLAAPPKEEKTQTAPVNFFTK